VTFRDGRRPILLKSSRYAWLKTKMQDAIDALYGDSVHHFRKKRIVTCRHILENDEPILQVYHEQDGGWMFLCGEEGHVDENDGLFTLLSDIYQRDPSLMP
jgi:hypothetical protein